MNEIKTSIQSALQEHRLGNISIAKEIYQKILQEDPNNIEALHLLGILEAQQQNLLPALTLLQKAIAINPKIAALHNSIGNILKHLGKTQEAKLHYEEMLLLEPNSATAHNNLANILLNLNEENAALEHYREAIKLKSDYSDAHYNLGLLLAKQGLELNTIAHLKTSIQYNPENTGARNQLAQIYLKQNQPEQAIKQYQESLKIDSENLIAQQNLGALMAKDGKLESAVFLLENALKQEPKHQETLHNLGAIYLQQNKLEKALQFYLQLLDISPNFDVYYNIGTIYMDQNRYGDALNYFLEAVKLCPQDIATHTNLGAIYLKLEDHQKAIRHYQFVISIQPDNAEIQYLLSALQQNQKVETLPTTAPKEYIQHLFDQYAAHFDTHLTKFLDYQVPNLLHNAITQELINAKTDYNERANGANNAFNTNTNFEHQLNILDLGCGTGLCGEKFRYLAKKLIGVDLSEKMLTEAKQKNIYDELHCLELTDALIQYDEKKIDPKFDLILAADTFVYLGELDKIFFNCKQILSPNGYLAFTCETTNIYPYHLQQTARYAHAEQYIVDLANKYGFNIKQNQIVTLRKQKNEPIYGKLYILQNY